MTRRAPYLMVFLGCLVVFVLALGWIGRQVLQLERKELLANAQVELEGRIRLALWRIDSEVGVFLAQENARPFSDYSPDPPSGRFALFYFQIVPDQQRVNPLLTKSAEMFLCENIPFHPCPTTALLPPEGTRPNDSDTLASEPAPSQQSRRRESQLEYQQRLSNVNRSQVVSKRAMTTMADSVREGWLIPIWHDNSLFLARRVIVNGQGYIQGCSLDWLGWKHSLLDSIRDLLPTADLEIVAGGSEIDPTRRLASLPAQLVVPRLPPPALGLFTPIRLALLAAWSCMFLAFAAVALLLTGAVRLSERRADFVSAVTHELRTPISTFRMYADMLAEGMVLDAEKRQKYYETLRSESDRLAHLVENVLAYARLERGRAGGRPENVAAANLVENVRHRLEDRAKAADMSFLVELAHGIEDARVTVDPLAVEQILFNLVDNACKYASHASDRRIILNARVDPRSVRIVVRDFGDGIPRRDGRDLFTPFGKSAKKAAESAPGIGLGLTLSRRLARRLRGDLTLDRTVDPGAAFVLTLPRTA